jgi:hypothetical protein
VPPRPLPLPPALPPAAVAPSAKPTAVGTDPRRSRIRHHRVDSTGASGRLVGGAIPPLGIHVKGRVLTQIQQKDAPPVPDLITAPARGEASEGLAPSSR